MKAALKRMLILLVLVGVMLMLSGCAYYDTSFDFEFKGEYMADKYVDLLIELDESDELYTNYNCIIVKSGSESQKYEKIPQDSEIVSYNENGFCSMLMHMKNANLDIIIFDSEGYPNYNVNYNCAPSEVRQCLFLPNELLSGSNDPYGEEAFLDFCQKYKKCRVATFNSEGDILQISKEFPLVSLGNFYLQGVGYDVESNTVKPTYIMSVEILIFSVMIWLLVLAGTLGCIITLIVDKINRNKLIVSYKKYIIAASIFNVPTAVLILTDIYCALGLSTTFAEFWVNLLVPILKINIGLIGIPINFGVLLHFIKYEKLLRKRRKEA